MAKATAKEHITKLSHRLNAVRIAQDLLERAARQINFASNNSGADSEGLEVANAIAALTGDCDELGMAIEYGSRMRPKH